MRELLSNNSLFVGQLYKEKSLALHARDLIFFTTDLQTVNYYSTIHYWSWSCFSMWPIRRGHFWRQGHKLNKPDRGLLGDATYQGLVVSDRKICSWFPYIKHVTPGRAFFALGPWFKQTWRRPTRWCYIPNIKALYALWFLTRRCFHVFQYKPM